MKILIIHASAGAGHKKAAEAIYLGFQKYSGHNVVILDALDLASPLFRELYRGTYSFLISKIPWLWGFVFGALDIEILQPFVRAFRRFYNSINFSKLEKYIVDEKFDYIISTHFMPVEIASALKRKYKINSTIICVVTDFDVHHIWLGDKVDCYTVASEWTKKKIVSLGVDDSEVIVSGIPTDEKFAQSKDISLIKRKLEIQENKFTVLVATGSFGIGPIEQIIDVLEDVQVLVVCGHNKDLFNRLKSKANERIKILGLVDNMYELMSVSNVMITKPGGLSIAEALVSQLPMIFFNAIPGQETNNIKVLKEYGIGISDCSIKQIAEEVKCLSSSQDKYLTALKKTNILARPTAVNVIMSLVK